MTYRQVETSREIRLWISQIVIPAAGVVVGLMTIPEVRYSAVDKFRNFKQKIRNKFKK